ncbi:hypothetical protein [Nocardia aurantia]|uniref:Uncharacterized protein n=1 Tax=Nocardia aurantia TaxID=2585199 RepID=A0A7K0DTB1_9NOCA|nr:hypothetical protein [Nocardia aurantia]MQY29009.1 hypothetical protein [Nocardia aurantia]
MAEELDDIGRETAALMKQMLQLATLVALRTRERGQKEAEARVKVTEQRIKDAKELALREARESKAKDPRNVELTRMLDRPPLERPGVSLERDRFAAEASAARGEAQAAAAAAPAVRYDSAERRTALAAHLTKIGVAPELRQIRMLMEVGQAQPASEAVRSVPDDNERLAKRLREQELARQRGLERSR